MALRLTRGRPAPLLAAGAASSCLTHPRLGLRSFASDKPRKPLDTFSSLNVLASAPPPASAVETIFDDGFLLSNGQRIRRGGALLVHAEAFEWRPAVRGSDAERRAVQQGTLELGPEAWGLLDVVHPKPGMPALRSSPHPTPPHPSIVHNAQRRARENRNLTKRTAEMLIVGTGRRTLLLSKKDRDMITELGIRMDVMDTAHAAAQYNMLATERPGQIAAALMEDEFGNPKK